MFRSYLRKISGCAFGPFLSKKLNSNPVNTNFPVQIVLAILKMTKNRDRNMKLRKLVFCDWREATIFESTVYKVRLVKTIEAKQVNFKLDRNKSNSKIKFCLIQLVPRYCVLSKTRMQTHCIKCTNAAPQTFVFTNLPSHKKRAKIKYFLIKKHR